LDKAQQYTPLLTAALGLQSVRSTESADETLGTVLARGFGEFPERALRPGDAWQTRNTISNPFTAQIVSTTHTLDGVKNIDGRELTRIVSMLAIQIMSARDRPTVAPNFVHVGNGEAFFDRQNGRLYRATARTVLPFSVSSPAPDGGRVGIQGSTTSVTTVELIEK
jgi:hypothetical protein